MAMRRCRRERLRLSGGKGEAVSEAWSWRPVDQRVAVLEVVAEADRGRRLFPKAVDYPDGTRNGGMNLVQREQAKNACDRAAREDRCTFAHVLAEEFWEAMCEEDRDALRTELVQVAAVALQWIENLDARMAAEPLRGTP